MVVDYIYLFDTLLLWPTGRFSRPAQLLLVLVGDLTVGSRSRGLLCFSQVNVGTDTATKMRPSSRQQVRWKRPKHVLRLSHHRVCHCDGGVCPG